MIRVFKANDADFTSNGDKIIKAISALITKNTEEEYLELEASREFLDYLVQDNILIADTPAGKRGYRINNHSVGETIKFKAGLCYNEITVQPADRGAVIAYGKNLEEAPVVSENWDDVVTKLTPIGYNDTTLPEGYLSVVSPHQRVYDKTIEFDVSESLKDTVKAAEETVDTCSTNVTALETSISNLQSSLTEYQAIIDEMENDKIELRTAYDALGTTTEEDLKQRRILMAQITAINRELKSYITAKTNYQDALLQTQTDLTTAQSDLSSAHASLNNLIVTDLRTQAQAYLDANVYPQKSYDMKAHLDGIVEIGDTVKVKDPRYKLDMLAYVSSYQFDCNTMRFTDIQFGAKRITFKSKITDLQKNIKVVSDGLRSAVSQIEQLSDQIILSVDANGHLALFKLSGDANGSQALISADNIELEGLITANGGFKILLDGSFEATAGKIAGFVVTPEDIDTHDGGFVYDNPELGKFIRFSPFSSMDGAGGFNPSYGALDLGLSDDGENTIIHMRSDGYARFGLKEETGTAAIRINDFLRYDQGVPGATDTIFYSPNFKINRDGTVEGGGSSKAISNIAATKDTNGNITSMAVTYTDNTSDTVAITYNTDGDISKIGDTIITYA